MLLGKPAGAWQPRERFVIARTARPYDWAAGPALEQGRPGSHRTQRFGGLWQSTMAEAGDPVFCEEEIGI
jgi:hypothetical protein